MTKKIYVISFILLTISAVFLLYFLFFYTKSCGDETCFENALINCKKIDFIREDSLFAWEYKILGNAEENSCRVYVRILKINQGKEEFEELHGKSMTCNVLKNIKEFPEKDMLKCSGHLKEELQELIIQRMHNYLLQNLEEIK